MLCHLILNILYTYAAVTVYDGSNNSYIKCIDFFQNLNTYISNMATICVTSMWYKSTYPLIKIINGKKVLYYFTEMFLNTLIKDSLYQKCITVYP